MFDLAIALNWIAAGGSGLIASYIFSYLEARIPWIEGLISDFKFALVVTLTCLISLAAWALLFASPDVVAPVGFWAWASAASAICFKAITFNQFTYFVRWRSIQRQAVINKAFGG